MSAIYEPDDCTCWATPPEMWTTHYGAVEPGSTLVPDPGCPYHFPLEPWRMGPLGHIGVGSSNTGNSWGFLLSREETPVFARAAREWNDAIDFGRGYTAARLEMMRSFSRSSWPNHGESTDSAVVDWDLSQR